MQENKYEAHIYNMMGADDLCQGIDFVAESEKDVLADAYWHLIQKFDFKHTGDHCKVAEIQITFNNENLATYDVIKDSGHEYGFSVSIQTL